MDYFSRYVEIAKLCGTTSPNVTVHLKSMFARHGIPELVVSDNGPQFSAHTFAKFAEEYGFTHVTTSPKYPKANGQVERAVETVKGLLKKACDPYRALMAYRATPLESGLSPAELLMGRKIRTTVPTVPSQLQPSWPYLDEFKEKDSALKARQKDNFDKGHCAKELPELDTGNSVWLPERQMEGQVIGSAGTTRSYIVETPKGKLRRNRRHLGLMPVPVGMECESQNEDPPVQPSSTTPTPVTTPSEPVRSRSGREIKLPARFREWLYEHLFRFGE